MLDELPVLVLRCRAERATRRSGVAIAARLRSRPAVVGSIAACSGVELERAQRAFGLRPARELRRSRERRDELGRRGPRGARTPSEPLDAFAGVEHDEIGGRRDEPLDPGDDAGFVGRVVDADERAAQHARAAALEQAREHVELARLGNGDDLAGEHAVGFGWTARSSRSDASSAHVVGDHLRSGGGACAAMAFKRGNLTTAPGWMRSRLRSGLYWRSSQTGTL